MNSEDKLEKIKQLISKKSLPELKRFFEEYSILADDYNNFNELLIYAIENDTSNEIVEYIIHSRADKNLNFAIDIDDETKVPLFEAVKNNYFDKADMLIKYKANINYEDEELPVFMGDNIFEYLYFTKFLNVKNFKYILNKGFNIIKKRDIYFLIRNGDNHFLEIIFNYINSNSKLILNLINLSKRKIQISNTSLNETLKKERAELKIDEYMYNIANEQEFNDILRILFKNDVNSKNKLYRRIIKYNLLEKSIESNDYNYVKKVLNIKPFNYKCMNYDKILIKAIEGLKDSNNDRKKISKLFIDSFIYDSISVNNDSIDTLINISYNQQYFNLILNFLIKSHNMEAIKYLIENKEYKTNLDINVKDINGEYPLINALYQEQNGIIKFKDINGLYQKQNEIIKYLIEHGGNCNIKNNHGIPLLVLAIQKNNNKIVEYILEKPGIHINEKCPNGYSAFMTAINQNNTDLVELILDYSNENDIPIDINEKDVSGNYPITKAINKNNFDMVILLMEYGMNNKIDMNLTDINGYSLLSLAYEHKYLKMFKYLTEYLDIDQIDNTGQSIIFKAVDENDIDTVEYLIHCGANLNIRDKCKNSVIDYAIFHGNSEILDLLLQSDNISLNEYNSAEETPLISLIKSKKFSEMNKKDIINNFIDKGCDIDKPDKKYNLSPLIHAINNKELLITILLINYGVNINRKSKFGHTCIRYGVNYNMGDYKHYYSEEISRFLFRSELLYNFTNDENLFSSAIQKNKVNSIRRLIPTISSINMRNTFNGNTLLHKAVINKKPEIVQLLIEKGINKSIINYEGKNAYDLNESINKSKNDNTDENKIYDEIHKLLK